MENMGGGCDAKIQTVARLAEAPGEHFDVSQLTSALVAAIEEPIKPVL